MAESLPAESEPKTSRRRARELAVITLYQLDVGGHELEPLLEETILQEKIATAARAWYRAAVRTTWAQRAVLDALVDQVSSDWRVERLNRLDLAILRLALAELLLGVLGEKGEPPVVISEAVVLAKRYCGEADAKFINGLLGKASTLEDPLSAAREVAAAGPSAAPLKKFVPKGDDAGRRGPILDDAPPSTPLEHRRVQLKEAEGPGPEIGAPKPKPRPYQDRPRPGGSGPHRTGGGPGPGGPEVYYPPKKPKA